ncbi:hsp90 co-chaperone Cdc37, partial [Coemansia nantahalensis]
SISHSGFDRSFVSRPSEAAGSGSGSGSGSKGAAGSARRTEKQTVTTDEILNPGSVGRFDHSAAEEDEDDSNDVDENGDLRLDADAKEFASLVRMSDSMDYIHKHLGIVSEAKTNQILGNAFTHELAGRKKQARQYVHQGLILTYIMELGSSGINMFFQRMGSKGNALSMFEADVASRYKHIEARCKVIQSESQQHEEEVESIQLQTDSPDAPIRISVPDEADEAEDPARLELFRQLPAAFQDALRVGTIAALNEALAAIPGPEAERILAVCGQGQFLHIDEEIVVDPSQQESTDH